MKIMSSGLQVFKRSPKDPQNVLKIIVIQTGVDNLSQLLFWADRSSSGSSRVVPACFKGVVLYYYFLLKVKFK